MSISGLDDSVKIKSGFSSPSSVQGATLLIGSLRSLNIFRDKVNFLQESKKSKLIKTISGCSEGRGIRDKKSGHFIYLKCNDVKNLGVIRGPVYDLVVPEGQRFVANGILVHNSTSWVMTSRYGSVYVPRRSEGKYDYTLNPWKVAVSAKSPSQEDEGQHITTFALMERREIGEYFKFKGFKLGVSDTRQVEKGYKLKPGERWFGKEEADAQRLMYGDRSGYVKTGWEKDQVIEQVIEQGLSNDYKQRDELNIIYFLDLEKGFPKWPWPFQKKKSTEGFGLLSGGK